MITFYALRKKRCIFLITVLPNLALFSSSALYDENIFDILRFFNIIVNYRM